MFDSDGYPTEKALARVRAWDPRDFDGLVNFFKRVWYAPDYITINDGTAHVSTAGWSGNENLIAAIPLAWTALHFWSHRRGGHYIFTRLGSAPEARPEI